MALKMERNNSENSYIKEEKQEGRKLFQNKKANIALIVVGVIIAVAIIGAVIFVNVPVG